MSGSREFYVGYQPSAPAGIARRMRGAVLGLILGAGGMALLLAVAQAAFPVAVFEFGNPRPLAGRVTTDPVPQLLVDRPGRAGSAGPVSRYLLTVPGKYGADREVAGLDGHAVRLDGTLIYRDGATMVEIVPGSVEDRGAGDAPAPPVRHGRVTLRGEIADSKCFLGVMNPGEGKPHRACAARCISGGAPPVLVVRRADGDYLTVLLVGADGRGVNRDVLPYVAEPVEVTGELAEAGGLWILRTDLSTLRRIA